MAMDHEDHVFLDNRLDSIEETMRSEIRLGVRAVGEAVLAARFAGHMKADSTFVSTAILDAIMADHYGPEDSENSLDTQPDNE